MIERCAIGLSKLSALAAIAALAACGGGGSGGGGTPANNSPNPPVSTQQVVLIALPTSSMGYETSSFGLIGGYTQHKRSQTLAFAPGQQVMFKNAQATGAGAPPHTLGDTGAQSFISNPPLSTQGTGGSTFGPGYQTGAIAPGNSVGPVTLTAGTYYIGCAFHYSSLGMRDVLTVSPQAAPGPQATTAPGSGGGGGNGGGGGSGGY
jgi:hypothetical protein